MYPRRTAVRQSSKAAFVNPRLSYGVRCNKTGHGPPWVGREAQKHGIGSYQDRATGLRYYKDIRLKTPEEGGFPWLDMEALDNTDGIGDGHDDGLGGSDEGDSM